MAQQFYQNEQIEAYITGELSGEESHALEKAMEQDPVLKNEVNFQSEVIGGVRNYRKQELKQMLNQVPVSSVNTYWKNAKIAGAGLLAGAGLVAGVWWISEQGGKAHQKGQKEKIALEESNNKTSKDKTPVEKPEPDRSEKEKAEGASAKVREEQAGKAKAYTGKKEEREAPVENKEETGMGEASQVTKPEPPEDSQVPVTVQKPESENITEDTQNEVDKEVDLPDGNIVREGNADKEFEVDVRNVDKGEISYKFNKGKLVLAGDFKGKPYELLELNINGQQKLYLYYKDQYYLLKKDQRELGEASVVKDEGVIEELRNIKDRK